MHLVIDGTVLVPNGKGAAVYARNVLGAMHAALGPGRPDGPLAVDVSVLVREAALPIVRAVCEDWRIVPVDVASQLLWRLAGLPRKAHALRADLVHLLNEGPVGPMPAPFTLAVHELPHLNARRVPGGRRPLRDRLVRPLNERGALAACRRAAAVIPVSHATARDVVQEAGVPPNRVRVAANGVAREFFVGATAPYPETLPDLPARYVLLFATGDRREMIDEAVAAFVGVAGSVPIHLVVAGRVPPVLRARIDARLAAAALPDRVVYTDFLPDVAMPALYGRAAALLELSHYEGFGLQAAEAMAAGTPVVATAIPALLEVVGDAGLTVDPSHAARDAEAALLRLLGDATLHAELGRRSVERARTFTWERCAAESWRAIAEVLGTIRSARRASRD